MKDERNNYFYKEKYSNFKDKIKETINDLISVKIIEFEDEIKEIINIEKEDDLFLEFLFFINYPKWITLNADFLIYENNYILEQLDKIIIYYNRNQFNKNLFKVIFHMFIYLLSKIHDNICSSSKK